MSVSIKDIAREAGVSHSTVSRALSGSPLVKSTTKERICQLAEKMGYTPNTVARSLVCRRTETLGLVVSTVADPFAAEVVRGIEETAFDNGFGVLLCESSNNREREIAAVRMLREKRVDGIVVSASTVGDFYMPLLDELDLPIVLVNREQGEEYAYSVVTDDEHGGFLAVNHLLGLGHRRIGLITGPAQSQSSRTRLQAYRKTIEESGIPFDPALVVMGDGRADGGRMGADCLLGVPHPPTAVFCYNDLTAIGAIRAIKQQGLNVPSDVSVVGFDDIPFAEYVDPPLTTVRQHRYTMGRMATQMMLSLLNGEVPEASIHLQGDLIIRESCAGRQTVEEQDTHLPF